METKVIMRMVPTKIWRKLTGFNPIVSVPAGKNTNNKAMNAIP